MKTNISHRLRTILRTFLRPLVPSGIHPTQLTYRKIRYALLFLLPTLVVICAVALYPLALALMTSVSNAELVSIPGEKWVGFDNYIDVLSDPYWWGCVVNTVTFATISTFVQITLGLIVSLMINESFYGRKTMRITIMLPWAVLFVVSIEVWQHMFHSTNGIVNETLRGLGLLSTNHNWFSGQASSFFVIILTETWRSLPFVTILLLSALQTIPYEHWEAARVNGVGKFRTIWVAILPQIRFMLGVVTIFRWLDGMRVFEVIYLMTSNSNSTSSISIYARERLLEFSEAGAGSAASILISFFLVLCIFFFAALIRLIQQRGIYK